ncbi:MAG: hypothetical protein ACI91R_001353 [Vicingaceae bacterium]|jgi:hypothetical protein
MESSCESFYKIFNVPDVHELGSIMIVILSSSDLKTYNILIECGSNVFSDGDFEINIQSEEMEDYLKKRFGIKLIAE